MIDHVSFFSNDYATARSRFCERARTRKWELQPLERDGGREGEFFTDLAHCGSTSPKRLLVITSGLHGVEGFLGSAIQLAIMNSVTTDRLGKLDAGIVLVHALNPFGFARLRRFDAKNVDLNRNFLFPDEEYRGSHASYRNLDSLLNPKRWPLREIPIRLQALAKIIPHGYQNLKQAIAEGQYDFPMGLFFGGHEPSETVDLVERHLLPVMQSAQQVLHLDIHSGLGKWGRHEMLHDGDVDPQILKWLQPLFGEALTVDQSEQPYSTRGSFDRWVRKMIPGAASFCWEFGTYGGISVLASLRAENAAYHWGKPQTSPYTRTKVKLKEAFCPASPNWRSRVISHAEATLECVIEKWLLEH